MTLYECLLEVKDPRRREGLRIDLGQMFCMIIVANICGYIGGRPAARFAKAYSSTFTKMLNLRHAVPSHVTFSELLNRTDQKQLVAAFNKWSSLFVPIKKGDAVSGDGKALGSTVMDSHGNGQSFESVVSLFSQQSGLVHSLEHYRSSKETEIDIVCFLINKLEGMGATLYLDALHTQKNGRDDC